MPISKRYGCCRSCFILLCLISILVLLSFLIPGCGLKYKAYNANKIVKQVKDETFQQIKIDVTNDCAANVEALINDLDKYIYLRKLQNKNEQEFYNCLIRHVDQMLPLVYTPVVGEACENYGDVTRAIGARGITLNINDHKGKIEEELRKWPLKDVRAIVVTDGERILGLGDLGANGMGIPVGKLALYTALGGVSPLYCLPVTLDVGTNNEEYFTNKSRKYVGRPIKRVRGSAYDVFIDEFVQAVVKVYGRTTLIQFEDFANQNAYPLLNKYRDQHTVFNDDIQGTAAVAVAGILAAAKYTGTSINDERVLFVGAGSAATGIANLIVDAMDGKPEDNVKKILMKDRDALISSKNCPSDPKDQRTKYCHAIEEGKDVKDLVKIVGWFKPSILIGVSGKKGLFTPEVLMKMAEVNGNRRPIIFPLSNPTENSECTAEEAYKYTKNKCLFASGSPFPPVFVSDSNQEEEGKGNVSQSTNNIRYGHYETPRQCNNANIFPGVALGIILAKMKTIPDEVFLIAAKTLAYNCVTQEDFNSGSLFPQLEHLRECSAKIAAAVVKYAFDKNLSALSEKEKQVDNYETFARKHQYDPY